MSTNKTSEEDIQQWIYMNFSPVPKIIFERAYKRKLLRNKFETIGSTSNKLSNVSDIIYLIHSYKMVRTLCEFKKTLSTLGFQILKTSDNIYFLQFMEYNLDMLQNSWIPLYNLLLNSEKINDNKPAAVASVKAEKTTVRKHRTVQVKGEATTA